MLLQRIVEDIFALATFIYVDDCFWVAPEFAQERGPDAAWQALVFDHVIQELLGWKLDGNKTEIGHGITLLGLQIHMSETESECQVSPDKA